jgi:hypothetical protein
MFYFITHIIGCWKTSVSHEYFVMSHGRRQRGLNQTIPAFCGGGKIWIDDHRTLEDVLPSDPEGMSLSAISSALFNCGWLGACWDTVQANGMIGLGDVGYVSEVGQFVTVATLHTFLISADGHTPAWKNERICPSWWELSKSMLNRNYSGTFYNRQGYILLCC